MASSLNSTTENASNAVVATGANSYVFLDNSVIMNNTIGVTASGGGHVNSYGNNAIDWNGAGFSGALNHPPLQ